ncbi:MAG: hypothetical protein II936_04805, partial [Oscillospiraceae bacterium]|nr:hypothetical protein [Oscillospiraceae bacterium]
MNVKDLFAVMILASVLSLSCAVHIYADEYIPAIYTEEDEEDDWYYDEHDCEEAEHYYTYSGWYDFECTANLHGGFAILDGEKNIYIPECFDVTDIHAINTYSDEKKIEVVFAQDQYSTHVLTIYYGKPGEEYVKIINEGKPYRYNSKKISKSGSDLAWEQYGHFFILRTMNEKKPDKTFTDLKKAYFNRGVVFRNTENGSAYFYIGEDGTPRTGWITDETGTYYAFKNGSLAKNTATIKGIKYEFDKNHILKGKYTGWEEKTKSGKTYYRYYSEGKYLTGTQTVSKKNYVFNKNGYTKKVPPQVSYDTVLLYKDRIDNGNHVSSTELCVTMDYPVYNEFMTDKENEYCFDLIFGKDFFEEGGIYVPSYFSDNYSDTIVRAVLWDKNYGMRLDFHGRHGIELSEEIIHGKSNVEKYLEFLASDEGKNITVNGRRVKILPDEEQGVTWIYTVIGDDFYLISTNIRSDDKVIESIATLEFVPFGTGLILRESELYYLDENGKEKTGWQEINGHKYYFKADGRAIRD